MFIKKITIKNFRLFPPEKDFEIDNINTPDGTNEGSGLNVFVGENGSGKTALLDAFALPILEYKTEKFGVESFNDPNKKVRTLRVHAHRGHDRHRYYWRHGLSGHPFDLRFVPVQGA